MSAYANIFGSVDAGDGTLDAGVTSTADIAYGPADTTSVPRRAIFDPRNPFGMAVCFSVVGFVGLIVIYRSLPG